MNIDLTRKAAACLDKTYREGAVIDALPEGERPSDRAEGYAIQQQLAGQIGGGQLGWKIAATSKAGQAHINVEGPLLGRLMEARRLDDGSTLALGANRMRVAEIEFAFRMGKTLLPRKDAYPLDEVLAAVESLHPSIEIPDSRYTDFTKVGAAQLIADNACAHRYVIGPAMPAVWHSMDLSTFEPRGFIKGKEPVTGKGANVLGDPKIALAWAINELSGHGFTLETGQIVMTGTCLVPLAIAASDQITGDFGALGTVSLSIT